MFVVTAVRHLFWIWASVTLRAEADMSLAADRLTLDLMGAPAVEGGTIEVEAGETFTIRARWADGYRVGDCVPLEEVADKLPISRTWQAVA